MDDQAVAIKDINIKEIDDNDYNDDYNHNDIGYIDDDNNDYNDDSYNHCNDENDNIMISK